MIRYPELLKTGHDPRIMLHNMKAVAEGISDDVSQQAEHAQIAIRIKEFEVAIARGDYGAAYAKEVDS